MPSDGSRRELSFPQSQLVDSLDEVAKGLAGGTISRRRALKMAGAALLGAAVVPFSSASPAEAQETCRNRPALSNRRCTAEAICHELPLCACARTVRGNKRCIDLASRDFCAAEPCERNRDCPEGEICVKLGACCGVEERQVCARRCVVG